MEPNKLVIFEYDSYRQYLKDTYTHLKRSDSKFSFRFFSRISGFQSSNFLKLVMEGQRNLSVESIQKVSLALKLDKEEAFFFRNLVLLNQAKSSNERETFAEELIKSKVLKKVKPLKEFEFNYYAHWYFIPVRELVGLEGFKEDPEWVAKKIQPNITPSEAKQAIDELEKLGLIKRNSTNRLELTEKNITTLDAVTSAFVVRYHKDMLARAAESLDRFRGTKREVSAVTLGLSEKSFKEIQDRIKRFRREIIEIGSRDDGPNQVYQLNFQLFPLTDSVGDEE